MSENCDPEINFIRWSLLEYSKTLSTNYQISIAHVLPLLPEKIDNIDEVFDCPLALYIRDALDFVFSPSFRSQLSVNEQGYIALLADLRKRLAALNEDDTV